MDQNNETVKYEDPVELSGGAEIIESDSVEDFIKQLEEKEKDLHITADTTFIEIAQGYDGEMPDFLSLAVAENGTTIIEPAAPAIDSALQNEVAVLNAKLTKMETERSETLANSQRRSKDFEAYKTRTERERGEIFQNQLSILAARMLPPLDNLDRALAFASAMPSEKRKEFQQFFDGIVLVGEQVGEALAGMGITPIPAVGEIFDPYLHEAVAVEEISGFPPNTITEELLRGYSIGEKVVRHSMVKVSKPAPAVYGEIDFPDFAETAEKTIESDPTSQAE
ncbi:MAG: nucleotide exchange factor GrpE [Pyrinomonadaceae bacterium]